MITSSSVSTHTCMSQSLCRSDGHGTRNTTQGNVSFPYTCDFP